ncbi:YaaC family protein [Marinobacter orientalis]|uniref:YaaC-like Protein n=1 Tax=Marinobacter orientalis TaxID=1928859 RepID=A0A7Y0RAL6_9GAMM|nr:YaaC family protein [Marinobacter orientalis]NMT62192.1 hypothetical protein [Marinobacter orientalis]TGX50909.1 hypothetical protein DIT72_02410 [Marinobacter orientalis]
MEWITTDNVEKETWRRLLEFANDEFSIAKIEERHGPINKKNEKNYKKQATQIRLCLLQAKEYLDSCRNSSLITSPNLLYYSSVSLCSATMLINGTGNKSLDYLRAHGKAKNHGFSKVVEEKNFSEKTNLLNQVFLKIEKEGFFKEWYETMPKTEAQHTQFIQSDLDQGTLTGITSLGSSTFVSFEAFLDQAVSLIDLIKRIPDLSEDLRRLGIETPNSRMSEMIVNNNGHLQRSWNIHNCYSEAHLNGILSEFVVHENPEKISFKTQISSNKKSAIVSISYKNDTPLKYSSPESRWTTQGRTYCYPGGLEVPEIVDCFGILYLLGMICRYYPDLWITTIDRHAISSKIIENTIETMKQKFPILALEILSKDRIVISPHLAPWQAR